MPANNMRPGEELTLSAWERGITVAPIGRSDLAMYLWFWEWNMFGAIDDGQHTHGRFDNPSQVEAGGRSATISTAEGLRLSMQVADHGVDLVLEVVNTTDRQWSDLASIIPCFSPGSEDARSEQFRTQNTWVVGPAGFQRLDAREIYLNDGLRQAVDAESDAEGRFPWSYKWSATDSNATTGLIVRESKDNDWVAAIAWERFLSCQGNNPWECMHLATRVGPLQPAETRVVRGRIYLSEGTKEDVLSAHHATWQGRPGSLRNWGGSRMTQIG